MTQVSTTRLYMMRALYFLIFAAMGSIIWPRLISHEQWGVMESVAFAMLGALSLTAALGIRYPLQMLPLLFFELVWKTVWLVAVALPLWRGGQLDAETMSTVFDCLVGVVLCPIVIPWKYVFANYVKRPGDRWRRAVPATAPAETRASPVAGSR
jgi:hypothetical protein